jgi:hypothetical protein
VRLTSLNATEHGYNTIEWKKVLPLLSCLTLAIS